MDKKGKSMDDHFKDSMQSGANPFLNAASLLGAYWGNNSRDNISPLQLYGMGMMPPAGFNVGMDKASASQQVPMNAANMNSNWYAMAQMAAQDYLTRLQMNAMMNASSMDPSQSQLTNTFSDSLSSLVSSLNNDNKNTQQQQKKNEQSSMNKNDAKNRMQDKVEQLLQHQNYDQKSLSRQKQSSSNSKSSATSMMPSRKESPMMDQNYPPKRKSSTSSSPLYHKKDTIIDHLNTSNNSKLSNLSPLMGVRLPPDTEIIKYTSNNQQQQNLRDESTSKKMKLDLSNNMKESKEKTNGLERDNNDWMVETLDLSKKSSSSSSVKESEGNAPLNLSIKSKESSNNQREQLSNHVRSNSSPSPGPTTNNLSSLQDLTAGIGNWNKDLKNQSRDNRPRNLGRGIQTSRPKKNTVASLLAQSRATTVKSHNSNSGSDSRYDKNSISSDNQSNTDSESHNDTSEISESEGENENVSLECLRKPLTQGWKRETIIRGLTRSGHLKGDVHYISPSSDTKFKNMTQIKSELVALRSNLNEDNFSFTARKIIGTYLQAAPAPYATDGEFVRLTESEVTQRLEEIRLYTRQTSSQLNVEQRIEIARQQQLLREAKKNSKDESSKSKEKQKSNKEIEKSEKSEMLRREKELKALQIQEAKRKRDEEAARLRLEEQRRRQEDKERKKQHLVIMKQLDSRGKYEEREKKRHQMMLEKLVEREQTLLVKKYESKILSELRKPREDSEIRNKQELPPLKRFEGQKLTGKGFADLLMSFEFLHNFGETLGFDMASLPSLESLHNALAQEDALEAEEELLSVITHLLVCAIEDPGIPNPNRHLTLLGQTLRQADITNQNVSEILRIYLYSVATGEIRQQTGVYYEKEKSGKFGDLHQNDTEERQANMIGKNAHFYEILHENDRYKLSEALKDKPYVALSSTRKAQIFAILCNDLLLNKAVCKQIETGLESQATLRREKFVLDNKVRKYQSLVAKKIKIEEYEKSQQALRKDAENNGEEHPETPSENDTNVKDKTTFKTTANELGRMAEKIDDDASESDGTEMEEDEDTNMTSEEVQKKLDKILEQASQTKLQLQKALNSLRGKHYGQDRYWRRYYNLPKAGGIYVEGLESAQKDLLNFQEKLEAVVATSEEKTHSSDVVNGNEIKKEEKELNGVTVKNEEIDIEDSIPSAILVQKGNEKDDSKFVEINHVVPTINKTNDLKNEQTDDIKMEVDEPKIEENNSIIIKEEETKVEDEKSSMKWFSLVDRDIPLLIDDCPIFENRLKDFHANQCGEEFIMQGHSWEIHNNLQFYDVKKKLSENQHFVEFKNESVLSTSGLKDESIKKFMIDGTLTRSDANESDKNNVIVKQNLEVESQDPCDINHSFTLPSIKNLTIHNLSVILQCENLSSNNFTPEEKEALEDYKKNGYRKSLSTAFVKKDDRHGWWKISDKDELAQLLKSLHAKGLRERNLRQNLTAATSENVDLSTPCPLVDSDNEGDTENETDTEMPTEYTEPEDPNYWNPKIAKRVEQQLLDNIEALEDKVANASMQIKGWVVPQRETEPTEGDEPSDNVDVDEIRSRILNLESAIERRYLKPPLGNNTAEAQLMNAAAHNDLNTSNNSNGSSTNILDFDNVPKALSTWRDAVKRSVTSSQLSMALYFLEQCVAWDKSIMKANCQFCQSGESEDKLLLCDSCDRGYHTYCFKPKMEKIPEGDWFCYECMNKATGEKKCIICGGNRANPGKLISCELCPRCYHHDCYIPPMLKIPRGKWYCSNCITKAPPKKKPARKQKELKAHNSSQSLDSSQEDNPVACPSPSLTSCSVDDQVSPKKQNENSFQMPFSAVKINNSDNCNEEDNSDNKHNDSDNNAAKDLNKDVKVEMTKEKDEHKEKAKADKKATKKILKEMSICKIILEEMEVHEDSWPFLLPVNTKQFPTYRKIIKHPMDLSTIKKNLQDVIYKSRDEFVGDIRQIFDNCEVFNEDDSPVGKAGHEMRKYFELRWVELTDHNNS